MKNRANTLAAILGNMEDLTDAYESAMGAEGSALKENETYLDSIEGRISLFTNAVQTMWMNTINSDVIKFFVDLGTAIVKFTDQMGMIPSLIGVFGAWSVGIKPITKELQNITKFSDLIKTKSQEVAAAKVAETAATETSTVAKVEEAAASTTNASATELEGQMSMFDTEAKTTEAVTLYETASADELEGQMSLFNANANTQEASSSTQVAAAKDIETASSIRNTIATKAETVVAKGLYIAKSLVKGLVFGLALTAATSLITKFVGSIQDAANRMKELTEAAIDSAESVKSTQSSLSDYKEEIDDLRATLADNTTTELEAYDARARLIEIQNELIDKFGAEAAGINLVTGAIQDQKAAIDELAQSSAVDWLSENNEAYQNAIKTMNRQHSMDFNFASAYGTVQGTEQTEIYSTMSSDPELRKQYEDGIKEIVEAAGGTIKEQTSSLYGNYQQNLTASFEGKTAAEIEEILKSVQEYMVQFSGEHGVDLNYFINELEKTRQKYIDEDYEKAKTVFEEGIQQDLYAKYATQYGAILDAQEEFYNSITDEERSSALENYATSVATAFEKAGGKIDENGLFDVDESSANAHIQKYIMEMANAFAEEEFELNVKADEDGLKTNLQNIISESGLSNLDDTALGDMLSRGLNVSGATDTSGAYTDEQIAGLVQLQAEADKASISIESLIDILTSLGMIQGQPDEITESIEAAGQAYSTLASSVEQYASVSEILNDTVYDNVEISEEQYETLKELIGSETEFAECIDTTNGYIVTNVDLLNNLVKTSKKNTAQNIKLAKSQAKLEYYEKYKELQKLTNGQKVSNAATLAQVNSLYKEMTVLQKTISKYSMLEHQLLGATNAYEEFAEAQEIDEANDYESQAEELVGYLVDAFHTGKLGAESAQAAIKGLVPESVYADLDTLDDKMAAVYKYFTEDLSDYFYVKFNDDGSLESAEMLIDNVKKFVENGIAKGVFTGSWEEWDLDPTINSLDELAEKMGVTKEIAYAFLQAMETYDISWIGGDASTLLDKLLPSAAEIKAIEEQMQEEFDQTPIDLTARVKVSAETMQAAGWDVEDGSYSTLNTVTYKASDFGLSDENGNDYAINVTPILPDGTVIDGGEDGLWEYINGKIQSGESLENLDIFLGSYETIEEAEAAAERLHELQEDYYNMVASYSLENDIYNNTQKRAELEYKIGTGQISPDTIVGADGTTTAQEQLSQLNAEAEANAQAARENITAWSDAQDAYNEAAEAVEDCNKALAEAQETNDPDAIAETQSNLEDAESTLWNTYAALVKVGEPTEVVLQVAKEDLEKDIKEVEETLRKTFDGIEIDQKTYNLEDFITFNSETEEYAINYELIPDGYSTSELERYVGLLNEQYTIDALQGEGITTTLDVLTEIKDLLSDIYKLQVDTGDSETKLQSVVGWLEKIPSVKNVLVSITESIASSATKVKNWLTGGETEANGTAHVFGTAFKNGSWGAPKTETALVGELGPELLVRDGRWATIGDNGAEFTDIKKGDIIFNHRQTKDLLSKGYVTGRGKLHGGAFASGTAYAGSVHPWTGGMNIDADWENITPTLWDAATNGEYLSDALDDAADSVDEFEETIDWIEIRMEEFDERIGKLSAELENLTTYAAKNAQIDKIIAENQGKYADALAGAAYYEEYAEKYLAGMNDDLVAAAKNGAIAITEFTKEQDEATVDAINNYREYAQKAADLYQQAEEILTEIRDSVIQKIDNIQAYGDAKTSIEDAQTEKLQNIVDYFEEKGEIPAWAYYGIDGGDADNSTGMFENSYKKIAYWTPVLEDMQKAFDEAVENGQIVRDTIEWYEQLEKLYEVQASIDEATIELEEFQNAINDLYWDNFDELINRLDYLKDETQSLIDLMDHADMVTDPAKRKYENGTVEYWTADDVGWTEEGVATLGLYAQQMEIAEYTAKQYAEAIDDLTAEYEAGHYSENEYYEKLNELKDAQYENIEAYYEAQKAIKELNETRIDSVKDGIEKEIEAYEELISKKKQELETEKDLYDFQKNISEQQKDIASIQRKLSALSGDNSSSAVAQRRKLEAELAEAKAALEESYYERSIEDRQNALDKELEDFQTEKDAEIEKWEEYLDNVEQVVADSLNIVQANASEIGNTLAAKAEEYNLTVSDAVLSPWQDGALAVSDYQTTFDTAMSSTMDQLEALKLKWQEVIDKMAEAGNANVSNINQENATYAAATKAEKTVSTTTSTSTSNNTSSQESKPSLTKGSYVEVKAGTKWYADSSGGGSSGTAKSGTIKYVNTKGSHPYNIDGLGWIKKTDIKGYYKGTKGVDEDQLAWIDELGEELVMHADSNGRLAFLSKGSAVIPHDISENLMKLGSLDPSDVLSRNAPQIGVSPSVVNNNMELNIDNSIGTLISIENFDGNNPDEVLKIVNKAIEKHDREFNAALRRFTR